MFHKRSLPSSEPLRKYRSSCNVPDGIVVFLIPIHLRMHHFNHYDYLAYCCYFFLKLLAYFHETETKIWW